MSGSEIAERIGTTTAFLPRVISPLVRAGWVISGRGPGGGYELHPSAREARFLEVVEATEGPTIDGGCVLRDGACPGEGSCPIHAVWMEAQRVLVEGFEGIFALQAHPEGVRP